MILKICSVDECGKPALARGFCVNHYATNRRNGTPIPLQKKSTKRQQCAAPGCSKLMSAKGYCPTHYARVAKYGSTELPPPPPPWRCFVDGCEDKKHKAHGLCRLHYERLRADRILDLAKEPRIPGRKCSIDGCGRKHRAGGFCNMHYLRYINHGDVHRTNRKMQYGEGKDWHKQASGYISRFEPTNPNAGPNGHVYQHRHLMSEYIGRPLLRTESVHHKNGDRSDNRLRNLELWSKSQPAGQRVTDKVKWCIELLSSETISAALKIEPSLAEELAKLKQRL